MPPKATKKAKADEPTPTPPQETPAEPMSDLVPTHPAPNGSLTIAIVDMGRWTARVFSNGRVEHAGRPGQEVEPAQAVEVLQRVVVEQHRALCPGGAGQWIGSKTNIMVGRATVAATSDTLHIPHSAA